VAKTYRSGARETRAVRGLDLDVEAGEWLAIMGPSGCGKSTLLHRLGGLDLADDGSVVIAGEDLARLSEGRRAVLRRDRVGYVFQFFNLVQDMTVAENLELPMLLVGRRIQPSASRRPASVSAYVRLPRASSRSSAAATSPSRSRRASVV
jgi:putative ABC transport system ATP-binding protein